VAGGGRIDMAKPEVQKVFFVGVTFGGEY